MNAFRRTFYNQVMKFKISSSIGNKFSNIEFRKWNQEIIRICHKWTVHPRYRVLLIFNCCQQNPSKILIQNIPVALYDDANSFPLSFCIPSTDPINILRLFKINLPKIITEVLFNFQVTFYNWYIEIMQIYGDITRAFYLLK